MSCCVPYHTTTNAFGVLVQNRNSAGTTLPRNRLRVAKVTVYQHVGYADTRFLVLTIATYSSCDVTSQQTSSMFFPHEFFQIDVRHVSQMTFQAVETKRHMRQTYAPNWCAKLLRNRPTWSKPGLHWYPTCVVATQADCGLVPGFL